MFLIGALEFRRNILDGLTKVFQLVKEQPVEDVPDNANSVFTSVGSGDNIPVIFSGTFRVNASGPVLDITHLFTVTQYLEALTCETQCSVALQMTYPCGFIGKHNGST